MERLRTKVKMLLNKCKKNQPPSMFQTHKNLKLFILFLFKLPCATNKKNYTPCQLLYTHNVYALQADFYLKLTHCGFKSIIKSLERLTTLHQARRNGNLIKVFFFLEII